MSAIASGAVKRAVKRGKAGVGRLGVERRCEKEPLKRRRLSFELYTARQVMRRKQADLRFKKAFEMGAPSRLQGPPLPTRAPILGRDGTTERVEDLQGRTDTVHKHFKELFTGSVAQRESRLDSRSKK